MNTFKYLLYPLAWLFSAVVAVRNWLYDKGYFKVYKLGVPVVSVGNISIGGSGKTPYILKLVEVLLANGKRPGVIYRGYKKKTKAAIERVDLSRHSASYFGDEASMLKFKTNVPVYVGADRVAVAKQMLANEEVDLILLDDAFQHRRLHRDLDIVILDATDGAMSYNMMPVGRAREPLYNLTRASMIALHKVNLAKKIPKSILLWQNSKPNITSSIQLKGLVTLENWENRKFEFEELGDENYLIVTGVAKPQQVLDSLRLSYPLVKAKLKAFADHHAFEAKDVPEGKVIVTEKDAIKIMKLAVNKKNILVMVSDLKWDITYESLATKIFTSM